MIPSSASARAPVIRDDSRQPAPKQIPTRLKGVPRSLGFTLHSKTARYRLTILVN